MGGQPGRRDDQAGQGGGVLGEHRPQRGIGGGHHVLDQIPLQRLGLGSGLRSAEPASVSGAERQTPRQSSGETARMSELKVRRQAFRAAMYEHRQLVPGEDATRGNPGETSPASRTPWRDAILQPPMPQIIPSAEILQVAAEQDIEHEAGG